MWTEIVLKSKNVHKYFFRDCIYAWNNNTNKNNMQGLIQAVFDIDVTILGTLIWACPDLILIKTETTIKHNSSFLIKSAT